MTESSQITKLADNAKKLDRLFNKAVGKRKDIERTMRKLKAQGLIYATTHMREKKYMYLLYASKAGEPRRREYIGTNARRMEAATRGIARRKSYDVLHKQLRGLDLAIGEASLKLGEAVKALEKL